jgi:nucleotide-binding universal stress UspA family protein
LVHETLGAQLVVVGARGHARPLLGTVSYALLRNAHCPVMLVRSAPNPKEENTCGLRPDSR